jgi:hypothetical protein
MERKAFLRFLTQKEEFSFVIRKEDFSNYFWTDTQIHEENKWIKVNKKNYKTLYNRYHLDI